MAVSAKTLPKRQRDRVREALIQLSAQYKNQTELARALNVRQQTVSRSMAPDGPIGVKLAAAIARLRNQTFEEVVGGAPAKRVYAELEGWAEAAREAEQHGESPAGIAAVARWPASIQLRRVEWRFVADLSALWRRWAPPEEREESETADAAREADAGAVPPAEASGPERGRKSS